MGNLSTAAVIHADQHAETTGSSKSGTLKTGDVEHTLTHIEGTESVSEGVSEFLADANTQTAELPNLNERVIIPIDQERVEVETEIEALEQSLQEPGSKGAERKTGEQRPAQPRGEAKSEEPQVYSSLFSLARSFNKGMTAARQQQRAPQLQKEAKPQEMPKTASFSSQNASLRDQNPMMEKGKYDQQEKEERQGQGQGEQQKEQQKQPQHKASRRSVSRTGRSRGTQQGRTNDSVGDMDSIFIRFMALMARILGQAEAEAHDLYMRIKSRTDDVDRLTNLISKLNSEKGKVDWSKDEEMKKMVDEVRALGVDIPEGKYTWTEEEKKLLKENIQMRKDSLEKVTQLERTDMQRYLQEASQCHQARSNVLKLLKEVMDTLIHNMRP